MRSHRHRSWLSGLVMLICAAASANAVAAAEPLDTSFIPDDAVAAVVFHPSRVLRNPDVARFPVDAVVAAIKSQTGLDLADLEQMVGVIPLPSDEHVLPVAGARLRFNSPVPREAVLTWLVPGNREVEHAGYTYHTSGAPPVAVAFVGDNTIVFGAEPYVRRMLESPKADSRLIELLRAAETDHDLVAILDFDPIRDLAIDAYEQLPPQFDDFRDLPWVLSFIELRANAGQQVSLEVSLGGENEEDARVLQQLAAKGKFVATVVTDIAIGLIFQGDTAADRAFAESVRREARAVVHGIKIINSPDRATLSTNVSPDYATAATLAWLLFPAAERVRETAQTTAGAANLHVIGTAMRKYGQEHGHRPPLAMADNAGRPLLSWRVALLPYLGQEELYRQFRLDEPWNSEHNRALAAQMPAVFRAPGRLWADDRTNYVVPQSAAGLFGHAATGAEAQTESAERAVMVVEADDEVARVWTQPDDFNLDPQAVRAQLGALRRGKLYVLLADGSVRLVGAQADDDAQLRVLFNQVATDAQRGAGR